MTLTLFSFANSASTDPGFEKKKKTPFPLSENSLEGSPARFCLIVTLLLFPVHYVFG
jgi:hypothetical protein